MVDPFHKQVLNPDKDSVQGICHDLQVSGTIKMKGAMVLDELNLCSMLHDNGTHMAAE